MNDVKLAFRQLLKNPGFTAVAVLTLALGIGANLALFTLLYDEFLRPRLVHRPDELWEIRPADASGAPRFFNLSAPYYEAIRKDHLAFQGVIRGRSLPARLRTSDGWEKVAGCMFSGDYFGFLGVQPMLGRGFLPEEDDKPGTHSVAVISHRLWQQHFNGDPAVLGKTLTLKGEYPENRIVEVVGVAPPGFLGLSSVPPDVIVPMSMEGLFTIPSGYSLYGRLKDEISPNAAADSLSPIVQEVTKTLHSGKNPDGTPTYSNSKFTRVALLRAGYGSRIRAFAYERRNDLFKKNGLAAFGSLLVLLIAVSNLANLLLARGLSRRREMATRLALGAPRWVLVRQLTLEGVLLASFGAIAALLMLNWSGHIAPALMSAVGFDPGSPVNFHPDFRVIAFAVAGALLVGAGSSVLPALHVTRFDPILALKDSPAGTGVREGRWSLTKMLLVAQVASSLVLLSGVCLCLRAIAEQLGGKVGFQTDRFVVAKVDLEGVLGLDSRYVKADRRVNVSYLMGSAPQMCEELRVRLLLLPGVERVGVMGRPPFAPGQRPVVTTHLAGHEGSEVTFHRESVGAECFQTLGIPLLAGREVTASDLAAARRVALVNESFVRKFWPDQEVLGKEILDEQWNEKHEVIGVVRDARLESPGEPPQPTVFYGAWSAALHPTFIVQTRIRPEGLIEPIASELVKTDLWLRESEVLTLGRVMRDRFANERAIMHLLGELAGVALGLTVLGAYGMMSYLVTRRTREIGIRLAVGAQRVDVARLILRFGVWLALAGIGLGLPAAFGGSLLLRHLVFGVTPFDLTAFAAAAVVVLLAILFACWLPASRAAKVDPMVALRCE